SGDDGSGDDGSGDDGSGDGSGDDGSGDGSGDDGSGDDGSGDGSGDGGGTQPPPASSTKPSVNEHLESLSISDADTEKMPVKMLWFVEKTKNDYSGSNSKNQNIIDIQNRIGPFISNLKENDQIDVTVTLVGPVKHGFLNTVTESIPGINPHVDLQIYRGNNYTGYSDHQHSEFLLNAVLLLSKDHLFTNASIDRESIGISSNDATDRKNLTDKIKKLFEPFYLTNKEHLEKAHLDYLINTQNAYGYSYRYYTRYGRRQSYRVYDYCYHHNPYNKKFILYNFLASTSSNRLYNPCTRRYYYTDQEEIKNSKNISHLKDYFDPEGQLNVIVNHIHNHTFNKYQPTDDYRSSDERISNETFVNFLKYNYTKSNLPNFRNYTYTSSGSGLTPTQINNNPFYDLTAKLSGNDEPQYLHTGTTSDDINSFFTDLTKRIKRDTTFKIFTLESECKGIIHVKFKSINLNPFLFSCNGTKLKVNAEAIKIGSPNIFIKYYR
ncbi:MAG: hypothetical protein OXC44_05035, partial [Proteobacteria bacterium]|nr:hypothetical protein [Pseudomonadota bacterium]